MFECKGNMDVGAKLVNYILLPCFGYTKDNKYFFDNMYIILDCFTYGSQQKCFLNNKQDTNTIFCTYLAENATKHEVKRLNEKHIDPIIELQNILNTIQSLIDKWKKFKSLNIQHVQSSDINKVDVRVKELVRILIPNIIKRFSSETERDNEMVDRYDRSDFLQSPFLLNFPQIQRSVSEDNSQSFSNNILQQLNYKRNKYNKNVDHKNDSGLLNSNSRNPYNKHYTDWVRPETAEEENINKKKRLEKIISDQESLIKQMIDLQNNLDKLKYSNSARKDRRNEIKIQRFEKQLELLDERKSELYYRKLLLSQNNGKMKN